MTEKDDIRVYLKGELRKKMEINPRYSMRAFARSLEISRPFLSKLLRMERSVSDSMLSKIANRLNIEEELVERFRKNQLKIRQKARHRRASLRRSII